MKFNPHEFWRDPSAASDEIKKYMNGNLFKWAQPEFYLDKFHYDLIILNAMEKYAQPDWSVLEVGSGTGRNLANLIKKGYPNVRGIEINQKAIDLGRATFPELAGIDIVCGTLEDTINDAEPADVIFSRGCLMHLPGESDWVMEAIAQKARKMILTSDDETNEFDQVHKYRRNYKEIFERLGFEQIEEETCDKYPPLPKSTIKRVFLRVGKPDAPAKPKPAAKKGKSPRVKAKKVKGLRVAVLIPTIYRPVGLRRSLQSLKDTAPDAQAVVAAEHDDHEAREITAEFGAIFTVVSQPLAGGARAWNDALRAAPGYDAYFTGSDDIEFTPGWLDEVLKVLNDELNGSGLVGINDNRWDRSKVMKMCSTHYLMTRDFVIEHMHGVAAQPFYRCDYTDMEANARARRAGKWAWAEKALVKHLWGGPTGDKGYQMATSHRPEARKIYHDREARGFPDDFDPILTE